MSEKRFTRRQLIVGATTAGIGGAVAGYLADRLSTRPQTGTTPTPTPIPTPTPTPTPAPAAYSYDLRIRGGYGWLFQTNGGNTSATVMSLRAATCSNASQFLDHKMLLIIVAAEVDVDTSSGNVAPSDGGPGLIYWTLDGATTFSQGMPTDGIATPPASKPSGLKDPFGPKNPDDESQWDDLVWVAGPEKAKNNAGSLASRSIHLTGGKLAVDGPDNAEARNGRWVFKDAQGNQTKRALTDKFNLLWSSNDPISIMTAAGKIVFKPHAQSLVMNIRHELNPMHVPLNNGDPLPHFAMLYDFVDGRNCDNAIVPTFEKRTDIPGTPTPGDLCPPLWMNF